MPWLRQTHITGGVPRRINHELWSGLTTSLQLPLWFCEGVNMLCTTNTHSGRCAGYQIVTQVWLLMTSAFTTLTIAADGFAVCALNCLSRSVFMECVSHPVLFKHIFWPCALKESCPLLLKVSSTDLSVQCETTDWSPVTNRLNTREMLCDSVSPAW